MNIAYSQGEAVPLFRRPRFPRLTRRVLRLLGVEPRLLDLYVMHDGGGVAVLADPSVAPTARCVGTYRREGDVAVLMKLEVTP